MVFEMSDDPVEPIGDRRAGRAAGRIVGAEHEMIDEELRAPLEEVAQRGLALVGFEPVRLVDPYPRQFPAPPRQLVASPRQVLFGLEQVEPRCQPFFPCSDCMCRHHSSPLAICRRTLPGGGLLDRQEPRLGPEIEW